HEADTKRVEITAAMPEEPALVDGDEVRLVQVVVNLVANAVKFTPEDGRVSLVVSHDADVVTLAVSDTGRGIPPDMLPLIFERFHQGDGSSVRGLGLGLAIVRTLTQLHGGRVEVTSEGVGRGARFVVTLPASKAVAVTPSAVST